MMSATMTQLHFLPASDSYLDAKYTPLKINIYSFLKLLDSQYYKLLLNIKMT